MASLEATPEARALDAALAEYERLDDGEAFEEEDEEEMTGGKTPMVRAKRSSSLKAVARELVADASTKRPAVITWIVVIPVVLLVFLLVAGAIYEFS
jgi:hypothetical protein